MREICMYGSEGGAPEGVPTAINLLRALCLDLAAKRPRLAATSLQ